jgi:hypothetical protein
MKNITLFLNMTKRGTRLLLALAFSFVLFAPIITKAQTANSPVGNGFRISPVRSEFIVEKGQSRTFTITLENPSNSPLTARPIINDFIASEDESGEPRLLLDADSVPPANDFKSLVSPLEEVIVPGNQRQDITVTISVPTYANSGGYYGAIRFVPVLPNEDGTNVALTASIGSIVLIQVPGDLKQQLNLVQLTAAQKGESGEATARSFMIGGDVSLLTRLKNTGNIHVKPFGKVQVKNMFGNVVHEYEFNSSDPRSNVLPDSTRQFVDDLPDKKWLGRYSAVMNLTYSEGGGDLITSTTSFWYFPTLVFYFILFLLIMLAVGVNMLIYRFRKKRN